MTEQELWYELAYYTLAHPSPDFIHQEAVDAFGAGERGIGKALGEYHGEMTGTTLLPLGLPLPGLQVYENMRAVDYLQTRPEVDGKQIGITGASGGGNQTMYAGAFDERFGCVVPTCSVGTYDSYLGAACCMCEVVPGAVRFTEEGDVLGLAAGRGAMITSATRDAFQFSVGEAKKSFARVDVIAKLLDKPDGVKHMIIESGHDYNQAMREAMYGWMTKHLKGEGDGAMLRISVEGGGCSGFQYKFDVDHAKAEDDLVISREGAVVLVDSASVPFLAGSEVDFVDDLIGASFRVVNPNATASCGCGTSFSI